MWVALWNSQEGLRQDPFEPCNELRHPIALATRRATLIEYHSVLDSRVWTQRGGVCSDEFRDCAVDGEHELAPGVGEGGRAVRLFLLEGGTVKGAYEPEGGGV